MDYQLVTGEAGVAEPLVVTTTFTHNDVFYKAALVLRQFHGKGNPLAPMTCCCRVAEAHKGLPSLSYAGNGEPAMKLSKSALCSKVWLMCWLRLSARCAGSDCIELFSKLTRTNGNGGSP